MDFCLLCLLFCVLFPRRFVDVGNGIINFFYLFVNLLQRCVECCTIFLCRHHLIRLVNPWLDLLQLFVQAFFRCSYFLGVILNRLLCYNVLQFRELGIVRYQFLVGNHARHLEQLFTLLFPWHRYEERRVGYHLKEVGIDYRFYPLRVFRNRYRYIVVPAFGMITFEYSFHRSSRLNPILDEAAFQSQCSSVNIEYTCNRAFYIVQFLSVDTCLYLVILTVERVFSEKQPNESVEVSGFSQAVRSRNRCNIFIERCCSFFFSLEVTEGEGFQNDFSHITSKFLCIVSIVFSLLAHRE